MKKIFTIAAMTVAALGFGAITAQAAMAPSIGAAAKAVADESKAGIVDQVYYLRHHHHRRHYVVVAPRYYGRRYR